MVKFKLFIYLFIILLLNFSCSGNEQITETTLKPVPENVIQTTTVSPKKAEGITGIIRYVGNEPHKELVITGIPFPADDQTKKNYFVIGELMKKLAENQFRKVKAEGTVLKRSIRIARSDKSIERYTIDVIRFDILE